MREAAGVADRTGLELVVDDERAGVDVADRIDQAHDSTGAAHVEARKGIAESVQMEERVTGQDVVAMRAQPVVDLALLSVGRMEVVPGVRATAARPEAGESKLR